MKIGLAISAASFSVLAYGQVAPSSFQRSQSIRLGVEYSNMEAGFPAGSNLRLSGIGAFGTFNWNHQIGLEGAVRFLHFNSYYGETEDSFLAGPRYTFLHSDKWKPFGAFELGVVKMTYPFSLGSCGCFAIAPTGGLDYRLDRKWSLRAEYQYQILPGSPNFTNEAKFDIKPNGFQMGVSYRVF